MVVVCGAEIVVHEVSIGQHHALAASGCTGCKQDHCTLINFCVRLHMLPLIGF